MDTRLTILLVGQISQQSKFAIIKGHDLVVAINENDQDRAWFCAQSFFTSLANISKVLSPSSKKKGRIERGVYLRQLLGVADDSAILSRELRNSLEHIDERLEDWYERHGRHKTSFIGGMGPSNGYTAQTGDTFFNWIDTTLFAVTFCGEAYFIEPLLLEVQLLHGKAEEVIEQLMRKDFEEHQSGIAQ